MSEQPLTPQNATIIVAGWNANQINDALRGYGTDAATVTVVMVTDMTGLNEAMALTAGTPWCTLRYANTVVVSELTRRHGARRTLAECFDMTPNDYAINPKLLNR